MQASLQFPDMSWQSLHETLVAFGRDRSARAHELGRLLLAAERLALHRRFGHASLHEYAERVLGLSPRQTRERLRVARALETLPLLDAALAEAALLPAAVRELTRVATAETESAWLAAAEAKAVHEIEEMVSGRLPGDWPDTPARPGALRHVLRFEVSGDTFARFREATDALCREAECHLDHDALLGEIARRLLGERRPEAEATRASPRPVSAPNAGGSSRSSHTPRASAAAAPRALAAAATHAGHAAATHAGHTAATHAGHAAAAHAGHGPAEHAGHALASGPTGATGGPPLPRHIPAPARREASARTYGRCAAPGCRNRIWVDVHHLDPRIEGGSHAPDRLTLLCKGHHRAHHRGALLIEGSPATGLRFLHADGSRYGATERVCPEALDRGRDAFGTLRRLGFPESRAHRLVAVARERLGAAAQFEELVREALVLS